MQVTSALESEENVLIKPNIISANEFKMAPKSFSKEAFLIYDNMQEEDLCINYMDNNSVAKTELELGKTEKCNKEYKCNIGNSKSHNVCQDKTNLFPCEICGKNYCHHDSVRKHMLSEHSSSFALQEIQDDNDNSAEKCENFNKSFSPLLHQLLCDKSLEEKLFSCNICGMKYRHQDSLDLHKKIHEKSSEIIDYLGESYTCEVCGEIFTNLNKFIGHVQCGPKEKPFQCKICDKTFINTNKALNCEMRHKLNRTYTCEICYRIFCNVGLFKKHVSVHDTDYRRKTVFTCGICHEVFGDENALDEHKKDHVSEVHGKYFQWKSSLKTRIRKQSERKYYKCNECSRSFTQITSLTAHKRIHSGAKPFVCTICNEKFRWRGQLQLHQADFHDITSNYRCEICFEYFITNRRLRTHVFSHFSEEIRCGKLMGDKKLSVKRRVNKDLKSEKNGDYMCEICGKIFSVCSDLGRHKIETHLKDEKRYECNVCKKVFSRYQVRQHMKRHSGERPFTCDICHKSFVRKEDVRKHMQVHTDERPYECNICGVKCKTEKILKCHHKTHMGIIYECELCSKSYKTETSFKQHFLVHLDEIYHKNETRLKDEKLYEYVCKNVFPSCEVLQNTKRHSDERPFSCDICHKSFLRKNDVRNHMQVHSDERPYECNVCGVKCKTKKILKCHHKIHMGIIYECKLCNKSYKTKKSFKEHSLAHLDKIYHKAV